MAELPPTSAEVFALYGRVMAKIGAFEQFMRIALAEHEIRKAAKAGRDPDLHGFAQKALKFDFGSLAHRVADKYGFSPDLRTILKEAKFFRNQLAHTFWVVHFGNLRSERGLSIIKRECLLYEAQFERVAEILVAQTGVDAPGYSAFVEGTADREEVFIGWEVRLDHADAVMKATGFYGVVSARADTSQRD